MPAVPLTESLGGFVCACGVLQTKQRNKTVPWFFFRHRFIVGMITVNWQLQGLPPQLPERL